jgi:aspartate/methionine/tyrosine aminotransferase
MKLAWIVIGGPEQLAASALARLEVIADTYLSMNAPVQLAAPTLLAQRQSINRQLMTRTRANLSELDRQLAATPTCSRLQVEGGWYIVVRVPVIRSDEELAIALLEQHNLLVQPGYFYDFASDGYLVLSLITPEAEFKEGVRRLLQFVG